MDWTIFWTSFWTIFLDYFFWDHFPDHLFGPFYKGGEHTIGTQGSVGCSLLVPREGWEVECYYSWRGKRRNFTTQRGVRGGRSGKHYW